MDLLMLGAIILGPIFLIYSLGILINSWRQNFLSIKFYLKFITFSLVYIFVFNILINKNENNLNNCQKVSKNLASVKKHKIVCLKGEVNVVVLFGDSHIKTKEAELEANKVLQDFNYVGIETSNLDQYPSWLSSLAWKQREVLDFIAYQGLGYRESSRETAKREKEFVLDLEATPSISHYDEEYKTLPWTASTIIDKRNLRIRDNILKYDQPEPLLVIVGKNHVKGLSSLLKKEGFSQIENFN